MTENDAADVSDAGRPSDEIPESDLAFEDAGEAIDLGDRDYRIYRCPDCGNVVLSMRECDGGLTCHDEPMERVRECTVDVQPPNIQEVLLEAFGLPRAGLDVCLCVIGEGPVSPAEIAERLDYDESTIRRYLNELVTFGLLEKTQLNREAGGYVNVYHSTDLEAMREETLVGFYTWAGEAASLIEAANLTKETYAGDDVGQGLEEIFWEEFADEASDR
jgi:desulfoferrodoxin-like iron-binding protein